MGLDLFGLDFCWVWFLLGCILVGFSCCVVEFLWGLICMGWILAGLDLCGFLFLLVDFMWVLIIVGFVFGFVFLWG